MTVDTFGPLLPELAESRQVIVPEMQAHGRTADIDRPFTYEQMADDMAGLMRHLGIEHADVVGYSMGGGVGAAGRDPASGAGAQAGRDLGGLHLRRHAPRGDRDVPAITPEMFAGSPVEEAYQRIAPNPDDFPKLVEKLKELDTTPFSWPDEDVRGDRRANADHRRRLRRRSARARRRAVPAARRRRDGRSDRTAEIAARGPAGHHPLHPARSGCSTASTGCCR